MGDAGSPSFGELLRGYRRAAGFSQEALAQHAELSTDAIAGLERGRRAAPHADTLRRLVHALQLGPAERERFIRAAEPPARREPARSSNNLPLPRSSFVGRTAAVSELPELLTRARLVTLVGPGGIGKTRLALEVARALLGSGRFADGIWLVDLSALDQPGAGAVAATVAAGLEVGRAPLTSTPADLARALAERRLLLVLDNCEHVVDACARLADALLNGCPELAILATSREALAIAGEVIWPVEALSLPDPSAPTGTRDVLESEAGQLFVERATASSPSFRLSPATAASVSELCRQLDGNPLAIELAAARANAFDVPTLVDRLADRFVLLRRADRLAPPRHQTLQDLVQWSYDLLSEPEQRLFARLAVFAGGWDLAAVEAIDARPEAVALLARLVDKSLVVRADDRAGHARYALLETLRQFAANRLAASGEARTIHERHARYYLSTVEDSEPLLEGPEQPAQLERLEVDLDNIRSALDWCVASDQAEPGLRVGWCLAVLAWLRGYLEEVDTRLTTLLELPSASEASVHVRARALMAVGYVAFYRGQLERAHRQVQAALETFRRLERPRDVGQALVWLGLIVDAESDVEGAVASFVEALAIFRAEYDAFWTARAATNLGRCLSRQGQLERAVPLLEEALATRRQMGDRRGVANTLHHLADALEGCGALIDARGLAEEARSIAEDLGDRFVTTRALIGIGRVAYAANDLELAEQRLEQALAVARRDGFGHEVAEVAVLLGLVAYAAGDVERARQLNEEGLVWAERHARQAEAARAELSLARLDRDAGLTTRARAGFGRALRLYRHVLSTSGIGLAVAGIASTLEPGATAARLAGAADGVLDQLGQASWTIERFELERALAPLRTRYGESPEWTAGAALAAADMAAVIHEALA